MECDVTARIASLIHQVHGHMVEARTNEQVYVDDGSPVDWENLRPCRACGLHIGKDENDPCIANLPGTRNACCGHGLPEEDTSRPIYTIDDAGKLSVCGVEKRVHAWGYVDLEDGRRIEFGATCGERIREAVNAALNEHPLPDGFRFAG
jgi:hypothetical protein